MAKHKHDWLTPAQFNKLSSIIRLNNNIKRNQEQTNEYIKKQSIKKYGVDSPNKSLEVRQKLKELEGLDD